MYKNMMKILILLLSLVVVLTLAKKAAQDQKPKWAKKDIRDYNDADMERLLDQWDEDEEPLEPDELPEHLRQSPQMDFSKIDPSNPEGILQMSKKGKTLMAFVTVSGDPTSTELEDRTKLWQSGLMNNHIQCDRFVIDGNRAIFMFKDGSQAWDAKDFLVRQEFCEEVVIENKSYPGTFQGEENAQKSASKNKSNNKKDEF